MMWCIKTYIIAYVKTHKKNKIHYPLLSELYAEIMMYRSSLYFMGLIGIIRLFF